MTSGVWHVVEDARHTVLSVTAPARRTAPNLAFFDNALVAALSRTMVVSKSTTTTYEGAGKNVGVELIANLSDGPLS